MKHIDNRHGFSLLELLTVVAIIAILAAILFPVFRSVKDKARQTACIANLHDIGLALQQYKLDNNKYPLCLLGYYTPGQTMDFCQSSLYPDYIKSLDKFSCPSAGAGENDALVTLTVLDPATGGPITVQYYFGDSYDWADATGRGDQLPTYMTMWAPPNPSDGGPDLANVARFAPNEPPDSDPKKLFDYARQLRFRSPDAATVVTWCMNHRSSGKAMVLFLSGSVVPVNADRMTPGSIGGANILYRAMPK